MWILSCNVRGLGKTEKRKMVRVLIASQKVELVLIQEIMLPKVDDSLVSKVLGSSECKWVAVESVGGSGGLLCVWNPGVLNAISTIQNLNFILIQASMDNFTCIIVNIYAPNDEVLEPLCLVI